MKAQARLSTQRRILMIAARRFYENGYSNTGIQEILELAGIKRPTLYYHFKSKAGLGLRYLEFQEEFTLGAYVRWTRTKSNLRDYLRTWAHVVHKRALGGQFSGCPFANFAHQLRDEDRPLFEEKLRGIEQTWFRVLTDYIVGLQTAGHARPNMDAEHLARDLMTIFQGSANLWRISGDERYLDSMTRQFMRMAEDSDP